MTGSDFNPGELTARIQLVRDELSYVSGAEKRLAQTYAWLWAKAEPLTGRELSDARQLSPEVTWRFTIWYRTDVRASDRLIYGDRKMEIRAVLPDEENKDSLVLLCEAKD